MATENQVRAAFEALNEQELQDLEADSIQDDIESELDVESESDANPENIVGRVIESLDIDEDFEQEESHHGHRHHHLGLVARHVLRNTIRAIVLFTRVVVKRMLRNAALRRKLLAATKRGPRAVRALLAPSVARAIPRPFRRATRRLLPLVIGRSFRMIARQAGLSAHDADSAEDC
jgi:hypothetical protein